MKLLQKTAILLLLFGCEFSFGQQFDTFSYGDDARQSLDVYPQKSGAGAPVLFFVHGGGWTVGRKSQYHYMGKTFQNRGFVFVAINYRLYPKAQFPAFPEDASQAVAWVTKNATNHGGDPGKIFLMGHSAGAHSVSLLATTPHYLDKNGVDRKSIRGVIAISSPMNLNPGQMKFLKKIVGDTEPDSFRPFAQITKKTAATSPPFLLLHGKLDPLVPVKQSIDFEERLKKNGGKVKAFYPSALDHISIIGAFSERFAKSGKVLEPVVQFIKSNGNLESVELPSDG